MGKSKMEKKNTRGITTDGGRGSVNHENTKIMDSRFSSLHSDPRFQKVPMHKLKVKIDSRFNRMFSDKSFVTSSTPFDKRGRRKNSISGNPLLHYYKLENPPEEERENEKNEQEVEAEKGKVSIKEFVEGEKSVSRSLQNHSHHPLASESSSESEEDIGSDLDSSTDFDQEYEFHVEEESQQQEDRVPDIEKETHRLAVVNMDWDHVKAVNLYVLLCSCLPKDGKILSVAVYPSEFGLKRMEEEALHGPVGLFDDDAEDSNENEDELDNEKLRNYEKNRLRYYYAVVECDSIATADYLYKACDGVEYERSGNVLDLRFIPDSMAFKHPPRDVAREAPSIYEHIEFHTSALQQSKASLSWDIDEPHRAQLLKRKFNAEELDELDLKEYLASDESENENNANLAEDEGVLQIKKREEYRALLQSSDGENEDNGDMEITFNTGLENLSKQLVENKDKGKDSVWEAYLRKRNEKKKARRNQLKDISTDKSEKQEMEEGDEFFAEEKEYAEKKDKEEEASRAELELLLADDNGMGEIPKGYNLKPKTKKGKGKKRKEVAAEGKIPDVDIDYDDPRFSRLFTSHLFALDPTNPHFKRSGAYAPKVAEKQSKGKLGMESCGEEDTKFDAAYRTEKLELSSLVRSVKMKSKKIAIPSSNKPNISCSS